MTIPGHPPSHLHALGRSITIVWAKTAPYLEPPSSLYLFICDPPEKTFADQPYPAPPAGLLPRRPEPTPAAPPSFFSGELRASPEPLPLCRGIVTADVLELGLSHGAIAARKLEGVKWEKEHGGLYWFCPLR